MSLPDLQIYVTSERYSPDAYEEGAKKSELAGVVRMHVALQADFALTGQSFVNTLEAVRARGIGSLAR